MKNPHLFAAHDDDPGDHPQLPFFRTWRGVYLFVVGSFILVVALLTAFTRIFAS